MTNFARNRARVLPLIAALVVFCACDKIDRLRGKSSSSGSASSLEDDCGATDCTTLPFVKTVSSAPLFELYATGDQALGAFGHSLKFFADARDAVNPSMYYLNANFKVGDLVPESAKLHYKFAAEYLHIPEPTAEYNLATYFTNEKRYFAGSVQRYHLDAENVDVYGVQFFPQDVISGQTIVKALELVSSTFKIPAAAMAFVTTGEQQSAAGVEAAVAALGYRLLSINDVLGSLDYLALNAGTAIGYLRVFPDAVDDLKPTDIPVFENLPLDLTVVAGVITKAYQDPNSHINLKSRERGTPNMVLRSAAPDQATLAAFKDQPVRITVAPEGYTIVAATAEEVQAALTERLSRPWVPMPIEAEDSFLDYDSMCPDEPSTCLAMKRRYGAKASNLGFLASPYVLGRADQPGTLSAKLGYDLSPLGFGVPFSVYQSYVDHPANAKLRDAIKAVIAAERAGDVSPAERRALAQAVRAAFLVGQMPEAIGAAVRVRLVDLVPKAKKVKLRSSANAEDIAGFNGAGLYDSFKVRPALPDEPAAGCAVEYRMSKHGTVRPKVIPDTVECGLRATWASLWNERAIAERSWSRLEHADAVMGLAVVPSYDLGSDIEANAVVLTRASSMDDMAGYALSTQTKNNLVTNPGPGSWSELGIAVLLTDDVPTSLTVLRHAKPEATVDVRTDSVLDQAHSLTMVEIAKTVEQAWCRADPTYYPLVDGKDCRWSVFDGKKTKALDFELKLRADDQWVVKQVRTFTNGVNSSR